MPEFQACKDRPKRKRRERAVAWPLAACLLAFPGCGVLSSSFLSTLDPSGMGVGSTVDFPPGFVVVTFANNADVDEQLIDFLESNAGGGLILTDEQKRELRPRVRLTVRITFSAAENDFVDVEFVSGSTILVEPAFRAQSAPDLNQNDLDNVVAVCEVQSISLSPNVPIEVFVPVQLTQLGLVERSTEGGQAITDFEVQALIPPQFRSLQADGPGPDGAQVRRNVGVEDLPGPIGDPLCGSVIGISFDGTLAVPFHPQGGGMPSFDEDDDNQIGTIGGRFEFRITIG